MRPFTRSLLAAALLGCALGCGGNGEKDGGTGGGGTGGGAGGGGGGGGGGGAPPGECDKAPNVARRTALLAAQPVLGVRSKQQLTVTVTFPSVADDPSVSCPVDLKFKDLDGDGALTPYEDWRLTPAGRAADLLGRLSAGEELALLAHGTLTDAPTFSDATLSAAAQAMVDQGLRFARTTANTSELTPRATWANALQERCEASAHGVPFVLSLSPAHFAAAGRSKAKGFSQWPLELGLAAGGDLAKLQHFGQVVSQEYRAIGVRMALSPAADLATEPRWFGNPFTFGEDATRVSQRVAAYVKGAQGDALGPTSVACVVGHFPGAGPALGGWDARLQKGRFVAYPGGAADAQLSAFDGALTAHVAAVMPGYAIAQTGNWSALGGLLDGTTLEQVGASFSPTLLGTVLRQHDQFDGLVLAPEGVLNDASLSPLGAPWGEETASQAQRAAAAVNAGVDQFLGLNDVTALQAALSGGLVTQAQVDAAATRALTLGFALGLFENPYVDPAQAPALANTDDAYRAGLGAMNAGMVLLLNQAKPAGWLNGNGDGTQTGDKGNAGNGSGKVLPAPPGEPYVAAGCRYYVMGNFDLDYVRSVSTGYGELTNDETVIQGVPAPTAADRIALSDYVFIRVDAPFTPDPDSGPLALPLQSLEYAGNANHAVLDDLAFARASIDGWTGTPASKTQLVVGVDLGRPSVVSEILQYQPSALYVEWMGKLPANLYADKVFLDVAFGIVSGTGKLPVGLPLSDAAAGDQKGDLPGDGQHPTFVEGYGLATQAFE